MNQHIGVVVNPTAGKHRGAVVGATVIDMLRREGAAVQDLSAQDAGHALERARCAVRSGSIDALVVVGGDGMANLGVNACAETGVPLSIVAAGTGNDAATVLGLPIRDPAAAVEVVLRGVPRDIDVVRQTSAAGERWFAAVLAAGFDALVNERANGWRWPRGQMRYNLAVLRELPRFRPLRYAITVDGAPREVTAMLLCVANGTSYGGGMRVAPSASVDDGLLDLVLLHEVSTATLLRLFPKVFTGQHVDHPAVEILQARRVTVAGPELVAYADGERFGPLPLTCEVVPGAVRMLSPAPAGA